jgi:excisionase family DNA binding protein
MRAVASVRSDEDSELPLSEALSKALAPIVADLVRRAIKSSPVRDGETRRAPHATPVPESVYLTRQQVASYLGYSLRTVTRLIDSGKLRPCGPRRDRVTRSECDRMMATRDAEENTSPDPDADVTAAVDVVMGLK